MVGVIYGKGFGAIFLVLDDGGFDTIDAKAETKPMLLTRAEMDWNGIDVSLTWGNTSEQFHPRFLECDSCRKYSVGTNVPH